MEELTTPLFLALIDEVERQGGELLEGRCQGQTIRQQAKAGIESYQATTTGCRKQSRFDIPYLYDNKLTGVFQAHKERFDPMPVPRRNIGGFGGSMPVEQSVTVCAIDDGVASWPRFQHIATEEAE